MVKITYKVTFDKGSYLNYFFAPTANLALKKMIYWNIQGKTFIYSPISMEIIKELPEDKEFYFGYPL